MNRYPLMPVSGRFAAPGRKWVRQVVVIMDREARRPFGADEAAVERRPDRRFIHPDADKDQFLTPIAPALHPFGLELAQPLRMIWPELFRYRRPPEAHAFGAADRARKAHVAHPFRSGRQPEQALGAEEAIPARRQERIEAL